jgi:hypothetical protein
LRAFIDSNDNQSVVEATTRLKSVQPRKSGNAERRDQTHCEGRHQTGGSEQRNPENLPGFKSP